MYSARNCCFSMFRMLFLCDYCVHVCRTCLSFSSVFLMCVVVITPIALLKKPQEGTEGALFPLEARPGQARPGDAKAAGGRPGRASGCESGGGHARRHKEL